MPLTPRQISQHFSNFFNAYTKSINKAYGRTGSLFEERFGREVLNWFGDKTRFDEFHRGMVDEKTVAALIDEDLE